MLKNNELDLDKVYERYWQTRFELCKRSFLKENIPFHIVNNGAEVKDFIRQFITDRPEIKNITFSDGVTLYQLDLFEWVQKEFTQKRGYKVTQPLKRTESGQYAAFGEQPEGKMNIPYEDWKKLDYNFYQALRESLLSDLLIISANAITMNGEIVSIDGIGNRVAGMIFGPLYVICIVGRNKIVPDIESAVERIQNYAAPLTYLRHNIKHWTELKDLSCIEKGICSKCKKPDSSCRNLVIIRGQIKKHQDRIHLIMVNQDLGF